MHGAGVFEITQKTYMHDAGVFENTQKTYMHCAGVLENKKDSAHCLSAILYFSWQQQDVTPHIML